MKLKQLNEKVERFENLEEKYGIEIKSISFTQPFEGGSIYCFLEVYGESLENSVNVNVLIYDTDGDIILKENGSIYRRYFNGFDVLKISFSNIDINKIGRIRIYPTT